MSNEKTPDIFISYSWKNANVADDIDNTFRSIGITFRRDIRDAGYRSGIKEFMQQISKTDYTLMLISDEFLRSEYCMYEVVELLNTQEFKKRLLPVVLENAQPIFKSSSREVYYDYWDAEFKEAEKRKRKHPNTDTVNQVKRCNNIYVNLDSFFENITNLNVLTFEKLKEENYQSILKVLSFDSTKLPDKFLETIKMKDEKGTVIETSWLENQNNVSNFFSKAFSAAEAGDYETAKRYYLKLLHADPRHAGSHYNLAILLTDHFQDYQQAKVHYEQALFIYPQYFEAHYNLAILLRDHLQNYEQAKKHFEQAIVINPKSAEAHFDLAILLEDHLLMPKQAEEHYEKALSINPKNVEAHHKLGYLVEERFNNYEKARKHYEKAIEIDPLHFYAHHDLANLLRLHFTEREKADFHSAKADEILINTYLKK